MSKEDNQKEEWKAALKNIKENTKPTYIKIPVEYVLDSNGEYLVSTTDESEEILEQGHYGTGKTLEEAKEKFLKMVKSMNGFYRIKLQRADRWMLWERGAWGSMGGTWFTILGIHVYFRHGKGVDGKGMYGGFYIPFTDLCVSIHNYWLRPIKYKYIIASKREKIEYRRAKRLIIK